MRLTAIEATDFLSFDNLTFTLDSGLNVVVGPGGSGKSTLVRVLDLVVRALDSAETGDAHVLEEYTSALRHDASGPGFCVHVAVELDQPSERQAMVSFVRAAVMSVLPDGVPDKDRNAYDEQIREAISEQHLLGLFRGRLAVAFDARPGGGWSFAYEFSHDDSWSCYMLAGRPSAGQIVPGPLTPGHPPAPGGPHLFDRLRPDGGRLVFNLATLLPAGDGTITLTAGPFWDSSRLTPSLREFAALADVDVTQNRYYTLARVLRSVLRGALVLRTDQRRPPRQDYAPAMLGTQPPLTDPSQLPLELFRLKEGDRPEQRRYQRLQAVFREFTGKNLDVRLRVVPGADAHRVELWVSDDDREVPIGLAGAGRWEAVGLSAAIVEATGRTVVLDEPAVNVDVTVQRKLLAYLRQVDGQVLLITHSPLLVPAQSPEDMRRLTRLQLRGGRTELRRLPAATSSEADQRRARWLQILAGSADARAMVFAKGVVLVEGDTELGAFEHWFQQCPTAQEVGTPDARNLALLSVGGDQSFEAYVDYLRAFDIPWSIVCDGPALALDRPGSVFAQLAQAGIQTAELATALAPGRTSHRDDAEFQACLGLANRHGVFTLAESFAEEIEPALERFDSTMWAEAKRVGQRSKVRRGRFFAQQVQCPAQVDALYHDIVARLA